MMSSFDAGPATEGKMRLARAIPVSQATAWQALSDPQMVAGWRGRLSGPLLAGALTTLDLGDGDFSVLEVLSVEPPARLAYIERFMGVGPAATLDWHLTPAPDGCILMVSDHAEQRTSADVLMARHTWLSVTERLSTFLRAGSIEPAGPADFEISIELPGNLESVWTLLSQPAVLPFPLDGRPGDSLRLTLIEGAAPSDFTIEELNVNAGNHAIVLALAHRTWLYSTTYHVNLRPRRQGVLLTMRHLDWQAISVDRAFSREQRRRFTEFWFRILLSFTVRYVRSLGIPTLSPDELRARMVQPDCFVFDSNRATLWDRGHIPGAVFVGQEDLPTHLLPPSKSSSLVFYCRDSL
jgi:uncharacterized protein YndB with AHSA1/START domain